MSHVPIAAAVALVASMMSLPARPAAQEIPDDFVVTLERDGTSCQGPCPVYSVTIEAGGAVTYSGTRYVRVEGTATGRIPVSQVRELLSAVERIKFFGLRDSYVFVRTDDGTEMTRTHELRTFVTVTQNGRTKRIHDYLGAPDGLRAFERQIEEAARTQRWVRIDVATLRRMLDAGKPPSADELAELLRAALYADEVDVVRMLLEIGADAHTLPGSEHTGPDKPLKIARSAGAMRALVEAGADPSAPDEFGQTVMQTAAGLPADVAEVLLNAGVPVDMPVDSFGHTALMRAAAEGNIGVVKLLLSAGATPALRTVAGSALDIARDAREQQERSRVPASLRTTAFEQDFDAVIVALEQALARQQH